MSEKKRNKVEESKIIAIVARRGAGKTSLLIDMLSSMWKNEYDLIIVISPTAHLQGDLWGGLDGQGIIMCGDFEPIIISTLMEFMSRKENKEKKALLVLDDLSLQTRKKENAAIIDKLAYTSRHYRISVVALVQKYSLMSVGFRGQAGHLYLFHVTNSREISMIYQEFACAQTFDEFKEMLRDLGDHEVLCIDNILGRLFVDTLK